MWIAKKGLTVRKINIILKKKITFIVGDRK